MHLWGRDGRCGWLQLHGTRTSVLAELIDVWPTMAEAVGVPLEGADAARVDGVSLLPALRRAASAAINVSTAGSRLKMFALSQYVRCPQDPAVPWKANACLFVDRSQLPVMGYTIRTAEWALHGVGRLERVVPAARLGAQFRKRAVHARWGRRAGL